MSAPAVQDQQQLNAAIAGTRRAYARAWKAWRKACRIRAAHRGSRPVKAWYDECRVMLARAERAHRRALTYRSNAPWNL